VQRTAPRLDKEFANRLLEALWQHGCVAIGIGEISLALVIPIPARGDVFKMTADLDRVINGDESVPVLDVEGEP